MKTSNKLLTSAAAICCTLILAGLIYAKKNIHVPEHNDKTEIKTTVRTLEAFQGIDVIGNYDIQISKGEPGIKIIADDQALSELETKVVDGILKISKKEDGDKLYQEGGIRLELSANNITSIQSTGNSDIEMVNDNLVEKFSILQVGNGTILTNTTSTSLDVNLTGNGDIKNSGKTEHLMIKMLGNGALDFSETEASEIEIFLTGNGDCEVNSNGKISGSMLGNGDLHVTGTAQVNVSQTGQGEILKK